MADVDIDRDTEDTDTPDDPKMDADLVPIGAAAPDADEPAPEPDAGAEPPAEDRWDLARKVHPDVDDPIKAIQFAKDMAAKASSDDAADGKDAPPGKAKDEITIDDPLSGLNLDDNEYVSVADVKTIIANTVAATKKAVSSVAEKVKVDAEQARIASLTSESNAKHAEIASRFHFASDFQRGIVMNAAHELAGGDISKYESAYARVMKEFGIQPKPGTPKPAETRKKIEAAHKGSAASMPGASSRSAADAKETGHVDILSEEYVEQMKAKFEPHLR